MKKGFVPALLASWLAFAGPAWGGGHEGPGGPPEEWKLYVYKGCVYLTLLKEVDVSMEVYDLYGRPISELADGTLPVGYHRFSVTGCLPSGIYVLDFQINDPSWDPEEEFQPHQLIRFVVLRQRFGS